MHEPTPHRARHALATESPARSQQLDDALTAGSWIRTVLQDAANDHLEAPAKEGLEQRLAALAAGCTYGGLALWTLNALTLKHEATGRLAETLAGLGAGALTKPPHSP